MTTPTVFRISVCRMKDVKLNQVEKIHVGLTKIGASFLPANIPVSIFYTNNDGLAKDFIVHVEYLY